MSFQLRIEFSGLCLFVKNRRNPKQVAVLMPDARRQPNLETLIHLDGSEAVPHAGYMRFDLGNALPGFEVAPSNSVGPRNEGVRRFDRETVELYLGDTDEPIDDRELAFPDFRKIDNKLEVRPEMFDPRPPKDLLMRMILEGGTFTSHSGGSNWTFPYIDGTDPDEPYQGQFANFATWSREIKTSELKVTFTPFAGGAKPTSLTLTPQNKIIRLKVSNLCAENPLEWPDLKIRVIDDEVDDDFRWLYRLVIEPQFAATAPVDELPIGGPDHLLHAPILDRTSGAAGIEQDCTGGKTDGDF